MLGQIRPRGSFPLDQAKERAEFEFVMIGEDLEDSVELMPVLQEKQMIPGQKHTILEHSDLMLSITINNNKRQSVLPIYVAEKIIVVPSSSGLRKLILL